MVLEGRLLCPRPSLGTGRGCNPVVLSGDGCLPAGYLGSCPCWGEGVGTLLPRSPALLVGEEVQPLLWRLKVRALSHSLLKWSGSAVGISCVQNYFLILWLEKLGVF